MPFQKMKHHPWRTDLRFNLAGLSKDPLHKDCWMCYTDRYMDNTFIPFNNKQILLWCFLFTNIAIQLYNANVPATIIWKDRSVQGTSRSLVGTLITKGDITQKIAILKLTHFWERGEGTPIYKLYRYVPYFRVWFSSCFSLINRDWFLPFFKSLG